MTLIDTSEVRSATTVKLPRSEAIAVLLAGDVDNDSYDGLGIEELARLVRGTARSFGQVRAKSVAAEEMAIDDSERVEFVFVTLTGAHDEVVAAAYALGADTVNVIPFVS